MGQYAIFLLYLQAFLYRWHEFLRHRTALGGIDELKARAALKRFEIDPDFGELAGTAGLLLVRVLFGHFSGDGFAIGHLRLAHDAFDTELGSHTVERDFQMQLAHAAQNGLTRVAIGFQMQRGIGAHHLTERRAEFFLLAFDLGLHGDADDRIRESACAPTPPDWPRRTACHPSRYRPGTPAR